MKPEDFIGKKAEFDEGSGMIFGINDKDEMQMLLDLRGWGAIQNLFDDDQEAAAKFQDDIGKWVAEAINEKLNKHEKV